METLCIRALAITRYFPFFNAVIFAIVIVALLFMTPPFPIKFVPVDLISIFKLFTNSDKLLFLS